MGEISPIHGLLSVKYGTRWKQFLSELRRFVSESKIMIPQDKEGDSVSADLRLVARIANGDSASWEEFVDRFTGWSLYRARKWCEGACRHRSPDVECGLAVVSNRLAGGVRLFSRTQECDEGMDSYIWIMEQLKKKAPRFKGRNNSRLSTFVWRILNSREFFVDWLRWKYGRVF